MIKLWRAVPAKAQSMTYYSGRSDYGIHMTSFQLGRLSPNIAHCKLTAFRVQPVDMPRAIISPSVLASDFGQLTAECKRMIKGGAEWLHMGMCLRYRFSVKDNDS
jgi:hypothetical protein